MRRKIVGAWGTRGRDSGLGDRRDVSLRLQVRAESQQTAIAILHHELAAAPWHVAKSPSEFNALGGVLGIKCVGIFNEQKKNRAKARPPQNPGRRQRRAKARPLQRHASRAIRPGICPDWLWAARRSGNESPAGRAPRWRRPADRSATRQWATSPDMRNQACLCNRRALRECRFTRPRKYGRR